MSEQVEIYTDGACKGNPGPGGWGALMIFKGVEKELWGGERETTNNRMELTAAIRALAELKRDGGKLTRAQVEWIELLRQCPGIEVYVWFPRDLAAIAVVLR